MSEKKEKFGMGAKPPPDLAWQMGKTRASIDFVREAESAISWIVSQIEAVKKGEVVLYDEVCVDEPLVYGWKRALKEPSPLEKAQRSFLINYQDDNMWCAALGMEGDEEVIYAYVVDTSKVNFPERYEGFKVVVRENDKPIPCT